MQHQATCRVVSRHRQRPAFTLIELLVVIAIIAILIGMLLPAVQKIRFAAMKTQCFNNLKQMALACENYASNHGGFPPSRTIYVTSGALMGTLAQPGGSASNGHGWGVELLPYIDQNPVFNLFKFHPDAQWGNWAWDVNQPAVSTPIKLYQCAAAPPNRSTTVAIGTSGFNTTNCNIAAATPGIAYYSDYFTPWSIQNIAGMGSTTPALDPFGNYTPRAAITDGTSSTILINECAGRPDYYIMGVKQATNSGMSNPYWWGPWPSFNSYAVTGYNATGTAAGTACSINCNNSLGVFSFHSGGANFAFCDGSARFIPSRITVLSLMEMFSRDGNEVPDDTY